MVHSRANSMFVRTLRRLEQLDPLERPTQPEASAAGRDWIG